MSPWRGAGVVERDGLENRCTGNRTEGSNPSLSAKYATSTYNYYYSAHTQLFLLKIDIQYHARLAANADLCFRIDLVVRDRMSGEPLSVIDTKYKISGLPAESDIQQVVAYAVELGVSRAYLVYPFEIKQPIEVKVGGIKVSTLGIDLRSPLAQIWSTLIPLTVSQNADSHICNF